MKTARDLCQQFCHGGTSFQKKLSSRKDWQKMMRCFFLSPCKTASFFEKFCFTGAASSSFRSSWIFIMWCSLLERGRTRSERKSDQQLPRPFFSPANFVAQTLIAQTILSLLVLLQTCGATCSQTASKASCVLLHVRLLSSNFQV